MIDKPWTESNTPPTPETSKINNHQSTIINQQSSLDKHHSKSTASDFSTFHSLTSTLWSLWLPACHPLHDIVSKIPIGTTLSLLKADRLEANPTFAMVGCAAKPALPSLRKPRCRKLLGVQALAGFQGWLKRWDL